MNLATPSKDGVIVDRQGNRCLRASADHYPLMTDCGHCGRIITARTGQDEWHHSNGQARCS